MPYFDAAVTPEPSEGHHPIQTAPASMDDKKRSSRGASLGTSGSSHNVAAPTALAYSRTEARTARGFNPNANRRGRDGQYVSNKVWYTASLLANLPRKSRRIGRL